MKLPHRLRPSPAMVVASAALLVALTGTGIAAVAVLPAGSVGTAQLKQGAVISSKVKNRSLESIDFARGQIPRGPRGPQGAPGPTGATGPAGPQGPAGVAPPGYVAQVVSQTGTQATTSNSTNWVDLPGSVQSVVIPTGETARFYAWFSAESSCYGGAGAGTCRLRITVDGVGMQPQVGDDFFFDSTNSGTKTSSSYASHSVVRATDIYPAGTHTIRVQIETSQATTNFRLDDWALVIERTRAS